MTIAPIAWSNQVRVMGSNNPHTEIASIRLVSLGAILSGVAVALGAFGAHGLKAMLGAEALSWWNTAVQYQMWHALAVLGIGLSGVGRFRLPALLLAGGAMVFSGTLYAMALGAPRWLGAVTPLGGLALIGGWALLAWRSLRDRPPPFVE